MNAELIENLTVPNSVLSKWQRLINALANLMNVATAVIMKVNRPYLKALITSNNDNNPIQPNFTEEIYGTYCEVTINSKEVHEVRNAYEHPIHKDGPEVREKSLVSYLGFPLEWPTGDVFGTICVADQKSREFSEKKKDLMKELKISVDAHLELIYKNELLKRAKKRIKEQRDNLKLLTSTVRHDIANNLTYIKGYLELKQKNSDLPEDFINELLPYLKSSIESIENIKKLEELFTKEKIFKNLKPKRILENIDDNLSEKLSIQGSCVVKADEFLALALKELIRNAFKHTETPKVDITLTEDETSSRIKIQDYGPGLSERIIESHFKDKTKSRELKGLTIVEKIMKRYDGDVFYKKNEKGSLFELVWFKNNQESKEKI